MENMPDELFIDYMERHSKTQMALFSNQDCRRLQELAGEEPTGDIDNWYSWPWVHIKSHIDAARKNIESKKYDR
jgi:hypothetical protein